MVFPEYLVSVSAPVTKRTSEPALISIDYTICSWNWSEKSLEKTICFLQKHNLDYAIFLF